MHGVLCCNGHDCGIFVMASMDLMFIKSEGWSFSQGNVRQYTDKCLLSLMQGRIVGFPKRHCNYDSSTVLAVYSVLLL